MSSTSSEEENDANEQNERKMERNERNATAKSKILREAMRDVVISVFLLVLTTIVTQGDFQKSPTASLLVSASSLDSSVIRTGPRTRSSRPPRPLFGGDSSYIDDYFTGDVFSAFEEADNYENAFIMFYAPWDADCLRAISLVEQVAKMFVDNDIYFAAVNCWEPSGLCHKEFSRKEGKNTNNPRLFHHQYPIFVFYPKDRKGIQYNGPIAVQSMLEFLIAAKSPYHHIGQKSELVKLRANHGGQALVGYFPGLLVSPRERSALKKFIDASYQLLEIDPFRKNFGGIGVVTSPQVAFNLQIDASRPVRYFYWNGTSLSFPNKTISTPLSLVTWTKDNPGHNFVSWIGSTGRKSLSLSKRLENGSRHSLLLFANRKQRRSYNKLLKMMSDIGLQYFTCDESNASSSSLLEAMADQQRAAFMRQDSFVAQCLEDPWFIEYFGNDLASGNLNRSLNQELLIRFPRKMHPGRPHADSQIVEMKRMARRLDCAMMASLAPTQCNEQPSFDLVFDEHDPSVWGLGCRDNRTLNLYVLDLITQWSLVQKLGLGQHEPNAIIVSLHDDKIFVMNEELSSKSLAKFVRAFHEDPESLKLLKLSSSISSSSASSEAIEEINADNFANKLLSFRTEPVIVLYKTKTCAFCSVASHVFHSVKRLISPKLVKFVTIDASENDLPWAFTALAVPSVLYFHGSSSNNETRAFPMEKPLSVPNLLSFIVANLDAETRVKLALSICGEDCVQNARVEAAQEGLNDVLRPFLQPGGFKEEL